MTRKIFQDIYVVKKSIKMIKKNDANGSSYINEKNVPIFKETNDSSISKYLIVENKIIKQYPEGKSNVSKNSLVFLWVICIISVTTLLFFLSSFFATATLSITPKNESINLNDTYNITSDKNISSSTLHFEVMNIKKDLSKTLVTDGEEYVEKKAVGKVILYNNYSTANQRLIINTRLETKEGLIYKTGKSVVIPGIKTINGVKTPGSIEVEIVADDVGDKYNMKLSDFKGDFTIFGFKGTPKYKDFYGRLSADLVGGFVGNLKKVSDEKLLAGRTELKESLKADLIKEIYSKKPEQYVLFMDNYYIQCNDLADDKSSGYKITEECILNAAMFNKDALAFFIADNKLKNFDNSKVDILWNDNDTVILQGATEKPWNETNIKAKFSGPTLIVWSFDVNQILNSIIGQDKSIVNSIIENNKDSLVEIQATIRPMWQNTFPQNEKKIKVIDTIRDNAK